MNIKETDAMCAIVRQLRRVTNKVQVAWKCLGDNSTPIRWYPLMQYGSFRRGVWEKALCDHTGFNCYLTKEAAQKAGWSTSSRPVKVRIRKVHGYNRDYNIVFAREIFVPKRQGNGL